MSYRKITVASLLGLIAALMASAGEISGALNLPGDDLFRSITQTHQDPALQGGVEYASDRGACVGAWGSSIRRLSDSDPDISSRVEVDVHVGYRSPPGSAWSRWWAS